MRHNILISIAMCMAMAFTCSCTNEPRNEHQGWETYTEEFIRTFGQASPSQHWRMSTNTTITVDLGASQAQNVKIATGTDDRYYLVGEYANVSGQITADVYVPIGTSEVLVDVDGQQYTGTMGQTINCSGSASTSGRSIGEPYAWTWALDNMDNMCDFDFNDVVIAIRHTATNIKGDEATSENLSMFRFIPMAVGNNLATYVNFRFRMQGEVHNVVLSPGTFDLTGNETPKLVPEAREYHRWFGSFISPRPINTGISAQVNINQNTMSSVVIIPQGMNLNLGDCSIPWNTSQSGQGGRAYNGMLTQENMSIFYITTGGTDECENTTEETRDIIVTTDAVLVPISTISDATASILIHADTFPWRWPKEYNHILDAYPGFKEWISNPDATDWVNNPVSVFLAPAIKVN